MLNKSDIQKLKEKVGIEPQPEFAIEHREEYLDAWIGENKTMLKDYLISGDDKIKLSFQQIGTSKDIDEHKTTSDHENPKALEAVKEVMEKFIFNTPEHQEILTEKRREQEEKTKLAVRLSQNKNNPTK